MRFEPDKHLHSKEHLLADDLSQAMKEPKKFAAYLGIAKLYYESDLRALAKYVREKYDRGELPPEARGKYFFAALKGLVKKPGVKFRRRKNKRNPPLRKASADAKASADKSAGKEKNGRNKTNSKRTK